jgi:2-polyprenyl-3-methyl-5-hydroxy-6-metoxy-1,4-benzoquinol methylase
MRSSLIYSKASIYEAVMRLLYGRAYDERFRALAKFIAEGSSVLDVCCGPGTLFHRYLKAKRVHYTGLDINRQFIERLSAGGATGIIWNLKENRPLPRAEYVVIQSSLYHFLPDASSVIERMIAAAEKQILIAEPIRNVADSRIHPLAFLARKLTNPGTGDQPNRFNEARLDALMEPYRQRGHAIRSQLIAGGREKLYILDSTCGGGCSCPERDGMVKSSSLAVFPTSHRSVE